MISLRRGRLLGMVLLASTGGALLPLSLAGCGITPGSTAPARTEILWDTWGIPHIYGQDTEAAFYAFGWAQAQSHADLLLQLYGHARGRAAEYWGVAHLDMDRWVRTMGVPARAREWYAAQSPAFRRYLNAFAAGINAYARAHADRIADSVEAVLPVTATDVLAHGQRLLHLHFITSPWQVAATAEQWRAMGSNAWAIAPSRSASGKAMLLANPHLPWSDLFLFYEAQLVAPGIDIYGATPVGIPVLAIAFNDNLGWTHTVNTFDGQDLYELTLVDGGYRWDGATRAFETVAETIQVKGDDGTLGTEPLLVRRSVHGPVVAEQNDKALALRIAGLEQAGAFEQWWDMGRARNLAQFQTVLARLEIPMFTVIYADRDGHILHLFGGRVPMRPRGDWAYWTHLIPGDTSATLWTRTHSYGELPRVIDPPSGWLQNANDPPWTTTLPFALAPERFPPYMAPRDGMDLRPQRSAEMLARDSSISFDEMIAYKHSTRVELADRVLDDLLAAARKSGGSRVRRAADVLEQWDRSADATSRGAVLFAAFARELTRRVKPDAEIFAVPWSRQAPLATPRGLSDPAAALVALEAAAAAVEADYGALDVPWGQVCRLRRDTLDLPANGGPGELGIFRVVDFTDAATAGGRFSANGGDSYVAAVEFSTPVRAMALLSYGNASQPGSPHRVNQLHLFARKTLRPIWRLRSEVEAHLERRERF